MMWKSAPAKILYFWNISHEVLRDEKVMMVCITVTMETTWSTKCVSNAR